MLQPYQIVCLQNIAFVRSNVGAQSCNLRYHVRNRCPRKLLAVASERGVDEVPVT
jgi:hypothetical protein